MKKTSFILSAIILAFGGFFAKAIGALYKIPLANVLGSAGMGIYYLIFPIYALLITFCSSGISVALTTEVAKCRKIRHRYNEQKLLRVSLILGFVISLISAIMIIIFSNFLAESQGNINANLGYIAIAPAIIISTLIAILRGYFQGIENMVPTTVSMIIEQIVKLSLGLVLAHKFCVYGLQYAVLGAVLGVTISEIVALIIIVLNFITYKGQLYYNYRNLNYRSKKKLKVKKLLKINLKLNRARYRSKSNIYMCNSKKIRYTNKSAIKKLLKVALPSTFASLLVPISTMLDSFMIINLLTGAGYSSILSTTLYGLWGGVVQSLISLPIVIVSAITTALVPALSGLIMQNDTNEIKYKVAFFIKLTWILSLLLFVIIFVYAEDILLFLYGDGLSSQVINELVYATKMLKITSVSIIYYSFLQTFTVILQSIGKAHYPFIAMFVGLIVRTLLIIVLVSIININIFGAIIANIIFLSLSTIILAIVITRYFHLEYQLYNHLLKPMIISGIILAILYISHWAFSPLSNYFVSMCLTALIGVIIYIFSVYFGKIFTERELKYLQFGKKKLTKNNKSNVCKSTKSP